MLNKNSVFSLLLTAMCPLLITSCSELLETHPKHITDTSDVVITCDATRGNKGLLDYHGNVYAHVGLITSKSEHQDDWRYVKFKWGSRESQALATPAGKNKWTFTIKNIREFFAVDPDEKIISLAILFRSGACIDIYCRVLRKENGDNIYVPVDDVSIQNSK